MIKRLLVIF